MDRLRLSGLVGTSVTRLLEGDEIGVCSDILLDARDRRVVCLLLSLGRTRAPTQAVIAADRFDFREQNLVIDVSDAELDAQSEHQTQDNPPIDPQSVPPVLVGPFGFTLSPAMATALINATLARFSAATLPPPDIDKEQEGWHWFGNLKGLPAFEGTEQLGEITDVVADLATLTCCELLLFNKSKATRAVPFDKIRNVDGKETHLIVERRAVPPYSAKAVVASATAQGETKRS
ncbi:MAG: hypothetical protein ACU0GG_04575 [Paracoccaceae bacterium]